MPASQRTNLLDAGGEPPSVLRTTAKPGGQYATTPATAQRHSEVTEAPLQPLSARATGFVSLGRTIAGGISPVLVAARSGGAPFAAVSPAPPAFGAAPHASSQQAPTLGVTATAVAAAIDAAATPAVEQQPSSVVLEPEVFVAPLQGQPESLAQHSVDMRDLSSAPSLPAGATLALDGPAAGPQFSPLATTGDSAGGTQVLPDDDHRPGSDGGGGGAGAFDIAFVAPPGATLALGDDSHGGSLPRGSTQGAAPADVVLPSPRGAPTFSPSDGEPVPYNPPFMVVPAAVDIWAETQDARSQRHPAPSQYPVLPSQPPAPQPPVAHVQSLPAGERGAEEVPEADVPEEAPPATDEEPPPPPPVVHAEPALELVPPASAVASVPAAEAESSDDTRDESPALALAVEVVVGQPASQVAPVDARVVESMPADVEDAQPEVAPVVEPPLPAAAMDSPEPAWAGVPAGRDSLQPSQLAGNLFGASPVVRGFSSGGQDAPIVPVPAPQQPLPVPQPAAGAAAAGDDPNDSDATVDESSPRARSGLRSEGGPAPVVDVHHASVPSQGGGGSGPVDGGPAASPVEQALPLFLADSSGGHSGPSQPPGAAAIPPPDNIVPDSQHDAVPPPPAALNAEAAHEDAPPGGSIGVSDDGGLLMPMAAPQMVDGGHGDAALGANLFNTQIPVDSQMHAGAWGDIAAFYDHSQMVGPPSQPAAPPPQEAPAAAPPPPPQVLSPALLAYGGGGETQVAVDNLEDFATRLHQEASEDQEPVPDAAAAEAEPAHAAPARTPGRPRRGRSTGASARKTATPRRRGVPTAEPPAEVEPSPPPPRGMETQAAVDVVADIIGGQQHQTTAARGASTGRGKSALKDASDAPKTAPPAQRSVRGRPAAVAHEQGDDGHEEVLPATQDVAPIAAPVPKSRAQRGGGSAAKPPPPAAPASTPGARTRTSVRDVAAKPVPAVKETPVKRGGAGGKRKEPEAEAEEVVPVTQEPAALVVEPPKPVARETGRGKRAKTAGEEAPAPEAKAAPEKKKATVKAAAAKKAPQAPAEVAPPPPPAAKATPAAAPKGKKRPAEAMQAAAPETEPANAGKRRRGSADADASAAAAVPAKKTKQAAAGAGGPIRVQITSRVHEAEAAKLRGLVKPIHGMACLPADKHSSLDFTHFVLDPAAGVQRTRNVLASLAAGRPIVSPDWISACAKAGAPVDVAPYLVRDKSAERKFSFDMAASLAQAQAKPLLTGEVLYALKGSEDVCTMLCDVAPLAGARVTKKLGDATIVIGTMGKATEKEHAAAKAAKKVVHEPEWLLNALMRQSLD